MSMGCRVLAECMVAIALVATGCAPPFDIEPAVLPDGVEGQFYSQDLDATGGNSLRWDIVNGSLPPGMGINRGSGQISGVPQASGDYGFTVRVAEVGGWPRSGEMTYSLAIVERLELDSSLADARVGVAYSDSFGVSGGIGPYTFQLIGLPAGMTYEPATGTVSGTPLNASSGVQLKVTVTDSGSPPQSDRETTFLVIKPPPVRITTESLPDGEVGVPYSAGLAAADGDTPYDWAVTDGLLPDGLSLDLDSGEISGTPEREQSAVFTITVTDDDDPASTDAREFTIDIQP